MLQTFEVEVFFNIGASSSPHNGDELDSFDLNALALES